MNLSNGILGEPNGIGNYLFCNNNPVDFVDPMGLKVFKDVVVDKGIDKYGLPIVCVQDMEYKWYYKNGISDRKPISDPKWRRAITNKDLGHFIHKNGEWKVSSRYYPTGALGAEIAEIDYDRAMKEGLIVLAASGAIGGGIAAAPFVYSACAPIVGTAKTCIVTKGTEAMTYGAAQIGATGTTLAYYGQQGLSKTFYMSVNGVSKSYDAAYGFAVSSEMYFIDFVTTHSVGDGVVGIAQGFMPYGCNIPSCYYNKDIYYSILLYASTLYNNWQYIDFSGFETRKTSRVYPYVNLLDTDIWQGAGRNTVHKVEQR